MLLLEILTTTAKWRWKFRDDEYAEACWAVDEIPFTLMFNRNAEINQWTVQLANDLHNKQRSKIKVPTPEFNAYGITGTGNAAAVMATAKAVIQAFKSENPQAQITFTASEPSRKRLYTRMVNRYAPAADINNVDAGGQTYTIK